MKFGGTAKKVTLFGFSAGASSVDMLGLSPYSRDYFHQAFQMSGSVFAAWTTNNRVINESMNLVRELNCDQPDYQVDHQATKAESVEIKACLKTKSVDDIFDSVELLVGIFLKLFLFLVLGTDSIRHKFCQVWSTNRWDFFSA